MLYRDIAKSRQREEPPLACGFLLNNFYRFGYIDGRELKYYLHQRLNTNISYLQRLYWPTIARILSKRYIFYYRIESKFTCRHDEYNLCMCNPIYPLTEYIFFDDQHGDDND